MPIRSDGTSEHTDRRELAVIGALLTLGPLTASQVTRVTIYTHDTVTDALMRLCGDGIITSRVPDAGGNLTFTAEPTLARDRAKLLGDRLLIDTDRKAI